MERQTLSVNMGASIGLLVIFTVSIVLALVVTLVSAPSGVQVLALALVTPQILLCIAFIHYCRKGLWWSYAGTSILGALGVLLRVAISTQPALEVGGGLPTGVTAFYIVLGALVSLKGYESVLEIRMLER